MLSTIRNEDLLRLKGHRDSNVEEYTEKIALFKKGRFDHYVHDRTPRVHMVNICSLDRAVYKNSPNKCKENSQMQESIVAEEGVQANFYRFINYLLRHLQISIYVLHSNTAMNL